MFNFQWQEEMPPKKYYYKKAWILKTLLFIWFVWLPGIKVLQICWVKFLTYSGLFLEEGRWGSLLVVIRESEFTGVRTGYLTFCVQSLQWTHWDNSLASSFFILVLELFGWLALTFQNFILYLITKSNTCS